MRRSLIILLTLVTAGIHLYFFLTGERNVFLYQLFLLNAIGYIALLVLLYAPLGLSASIQRLVRPVFIGYVVLTIVLYVILSAQSGIWSFPLAPISKVDELILVWLLWTERKAEMPNPASRKSDAML
jgi:hypothetical protein